MQLEGRAGNLEAKVALLEPDPAAMNRTLARTTEDLKQAQADAYSKDKVIDGLKGDVAAIKKDCDAKGKAK